MHLFLVRHGMASHNLPEGTSVLPAPAPEFAYWEKKKGDSALTVQGLIQVALLGRRLSGIHFDAIISSPLQRAMGTAYSVVKYGKNRPVIECLPDLMECGNYGDCWMPEDVLKAKFGDITPCGNMQPTQWISAYPRENSECETRARAERVRDYLVSRFHSNENILIASHGAFMGRYLIPALIGVPDSMRSTAKFCVENASLTEIVIEKNQPALIVLLNDVSHLGKYISRDIFSLNMQNLEGSAHPLNIEEMDTSILND